MVDPLNSFILLLYCGKKCLSRKMQSAGINVVNIWCRYMLLLL